MVVLGTDPEHFSSPWVKNEWTRFLALIKQGKKKLLIPAYRDMDPYDLPTEFSHLQAQDMSKLGFMQDLTRGIKKIVGNEKQETSRQKESHTQAASTKANPLLERAFIFIEDGDFDSGDEYCEKVLDLDPRCAEAYLGKLMIDLEVQKRSKLSLAKYSFRDNVNYKRIIRFGSAELIAEVDSALSVIEEADRQRAEAEREEERRKRAESEERRAREEEEISILKSAEYERRLSEVTQQYESIPSEKKIEREAKARGGIKMLTVATIISFIVYWPLGIILFIIRHNKIKSAIKEANDKYDNIRYEYKRLKAQKSAGERYALIVRREEQFFLWDSDVEMTVDNSLYTVRRDTSTRLSLSEGYHSIDFKGAFREKHIDLNIQRNTTITLSRNRLTGALEANISGDYDSDDFSSLD